MYMLARWSLVVALAAAPVGCALLGPTHGLISPYDSLEARAAALRDVGGLAAVGVGTSRGVGLALDKAKTRAVTELSFVVRRRFDRFNESLAAEIGSAAAEPLQAFVDAVCTQVVYQIQRGSTPLALDSETVEGTIRAYALMTHDPAVLRDALNDHGRAHPDLLEAIRRTAAFARLVAEVEAFTSPDTSAR